MSFSKRTALQGFNHPTLVAPGELATIPFSAPMVMRPHTVALPVAHERWTPTLVLIHRPDGTDQRREVRPHSGERAEGQPRRFEVVDAPTLEEADRWSLVLRNDGPEPAPVRGAFLVETYGYDFADDFADHQPSVAVERLEAARRECDEIWQEAIASVVRAEQRAARKLEDVAPPAAT